MRHWKHLVDCAPLLWTRAGPKKHLQKQLICANNSSYSFIFNFSLPLYFSCQTQHNTWQFITLNVTFCVTALNQQIVHLLLFVISLSCSKWNSIMRVSLFRIYGQTLIVTFCWKNTQAVVKSMLPCFYSTCELSQIITNRNRSCKMYEQWIKGQFSVKR